MIKIKVSCSSSNSTSETGTERLFAMLTPFALIQCAGLPAATLGNETAMHLPLTQPCAQVTSMPPSADASVPGHRRLVRRSWCTSVCRRPRTATTFAVAALAAAAAGASSPASVRLATGRMLQPHHVLHHAPPAQHAGCPLYRHFLVT